MVVAQRDSQDFLPGNLSNLTLINNVNFQVPFLIICTHFKNILFTLNNMIVNRQKQKQKHPT
jgi:hypothetical protein